MYKLNCIILIGAKPKQYIFNYAHSVVIESTWKSLTQTAKIILPRSVTMKNIFRPDLSAWTINLFNVIHIGDPVTIQLGYNGQVNTEFTGFVSGLDPHVPFQINCEDNMWQLKTNQILTKTTGITTLQKFIDTVVPAPYNAGAVVTDADFDSFYINKGVTSAGAMQILKRDFGLPFFYLNNILYAGQSYPDADKRKTVNYHFQKNIIKDNLEYQSAGEVKFKIKGVLLLPNHKTITQTVGESGGQLLTIPYTGISPDQLLKQITADYNRLHATRWKGSFETFGWPNVQHGMQANLIDNIIQERNGLFNIDKVITTFGVTGYRRNIFIGALNSDQ